MDKKIFLFIIILLIIISLVPKYRNVVIKLFNSLMLNLSGSSSNNITSSSRVSIMENIESVLAKVIFDYKKKALAYYLYLESSQQKISNAQRERIYETYGKVLGTPVIDWYAAFEFLDSDYYLLDEYLKEYLHSRNYFKHQDWVLTDRFREMLLDEAKKEADEKIKEFI